MPYATNANVASEFKSIVFDTTTTVTDTEIDRFILEEEEVIDAFVGKRYETPVLEGVSPKSFKILTKISVMLVADRVRDIMEVKNVTDEVNQGTRPASSSSKAMKMLREIASNEMPLSDATDLSTKGGVESFAVQQGIEHQFDKSIDQW